MASSDRWADANEAWKRAIGPGNVADGETDLASANRATFAHASRIVVVLRPQTREGVATCLAIAAERNVPVHPVSRGRNWGYGSRLPVKGEAALLSLEALNRISNFDDQLGFVTIEPGVTLGHLSTFLERSNWWPPQTGAGSDASVLGNVLERGIGKGPYEDMSQLMCGSEVLLANGNTLRTGMSGIPGADASLATAIAPGPAIGGLLAQSNLGVVVSMTLRLAPRPSHLRLFFARLKGADALAQAVDAMRPWLQRWPSGREASLLNGARVQAQVYEPDSADFQKFTEAGIHDDWMIGATLWSDDADDIALRIRALRAAIEGFAFDLTEIPAERSEISALSEDGLRTAYWAKGVAMPPRPDPDRDGCGIMWVVPTLPMRGAQVVPALSEIGAIMRAHGFPAAVSLRLGDGKIAKAVIPLLFDRSTEGADARASECAAAVRQFALDRGFIPYRLSVADMGHVPADPGTTQLLQTLRAWADPNGVISPHRYID